MKAVLTFPPDRDGELHIEVTRRLEGSSEHLEVSLKIAMESGERTKDTLRRLGLHLVRQPMHLYYDDKEIER